MNKKLWNAIYNARKEFKPLRLNKTAQAGQQRFRYADLKAIYDSTMPALEKHGLIVAQGIDQPEDEDTGTFIRLMVIHIESGESTEMWTPIPDQGQDPRRWGSAITYFKRYSYASFFCLHAEEDDDGTTASLLSSEEKRKEVERLMNKHPKLKEIMSPQWPVEESRLDGALTFATSWVKNNG